MNKQKKLIRQRITEKLKPGEWEYIQDPEQLNQLYALKIREELEEIQNSLHNDISEFADLMQVVIDFAQANGIGYPALENARIAKTLERGRFTNLALNNLNPHNGSNHLYFNNVAEPMRAVSTIEYKGHTVTVHETRNGFTARVNHGGKYEDYPGYTSADACMTEIKGFIDERMMILNR